MKKIILAPLAAIAISLVGCGNSGTDYTDNTKLKIRFHVNADTPEGMAYSQLIADFNRENKDGIKVTATFIARSAGDTTYDLELQRDKKNGTLPDIITFDAPKCSEYASYDYFYDLTDHFTAQEKESFMSLNTYKGRLYGLPIQESSAGIYYNKNYFNQAGIDVSGYTVDNPWTYDQFKEACAKIASSLPGITPAVMRYKDNNSEMATYLLYPFIYASGGGFVDETGKNCLGIFNSDASKRGYQFLKDLLNAGYTNYNVEEQTFYKGEAAMLLSSGWTIPLMKEYPTTFPDRNSWGLLPYPKDVTRASANGSWSFAIGNNPRKDKTNVVKLLKYLTNANASTKITNATGMIPANKEAQQSYPAGSPEAVLMEQLQQTSMARPSTVGYRQFSDAFRMVISGLLNEEVSSLVDNKANVLQSELNKIK